MIDYTRKWYSEALLKYICFKSVKSLWYRGKGTRGLIERRKRAGDFHFWFIPRSSHPVCPLPAWLVVACSWCHSFEPSLQLTFWPCQQHRRGIIEILEYEKHGGIALGGSFHMHINDQIGIVLRVNIDLKPGKVFFKLFIKLIEMHNREC